MGNSARSRSTCAQQARATVASSQSSTPSPRVLAAAALGVLVHLQNQRRGGMAHLASCPNGHSVNTCTVTCRQIRQLLELAEAMGITPLPPVV